MKKNLSLLVIANLIKGFYQWALLILIVKFLSSNDVGLFTLYFAITAPIYMLFNMQFKSIYVVDHRRNNYDYNYFVLRILFLIFSFLVIYILSYYKDYNLNIIILIGLIKSIESMSDMIYSDFQKKEKMDYMAYSIILHSVLSLIIFSFTIYITKDLIYSLFSIILTMTIILVFYDFRTIINLNNLNIKYFIFIKDNFYKENNILFIKKLLYNSIPLGLSVFIVSFITNLPRIYVEENLGLEKLAFFGAMSYMSIGFFQLLIPLQTIIRPKLAFYNRKKNFKMFSKILFLSIGITLLYTFILYTFFYIFGDKILMYLYNKDYVEYLNILLLMFIAQSILVINVFFNISIQTFFIFKSQLIISLMTLIVLLLSINYLIEMYSMMGAVYAISINAIFSFLCYFFLLIWNLKKIKCIIK